MPKWYNIAIEFAGGYMHTRQKIIYYTDELNDEFAGDAIEPKHIDGEYPYIRRSIGQRIAHVFWYRIIATP